jgi:L-ascorbate metabolism protein UlaG (beta-lactamase superfamily)
MSRLKMSRFKWVIAAIVLVVVMALPVAVQGLPTPTSKATGTQLHWYGQSAFKVITPSGKVLLLDPFIVNPVNANGKADIASLAKVDLILVTHGHGDHVGNAVEIAQKTNAKLVTTYDLGTAMVSHNGYPKQLVGFDTQGNFGGELTLLNGEVKVAFIPAVHSSTVATDGSPMTYYAGNPGGFLVSIKNGPVIYHTGDTDLFGDMALIPKFRPVTVMLACIGDQFTMGPDRAASAVKLVNPQTVIPMHFGMFGLPGTPADFATALKQQGAKAKMQVMQVGQTIPL